MIHYSSWYTIDLSKNLKGLSYRQYTEYMHTCRRYLYDTIGKENIGWSYRTIASIPGKRELIFYIQDQEHALAFKLKFG